MSFCTIFLPAPNFEMNNQSDCSLYLVITSTRTPAFECAPKPNVTTPPNYTHLHPAELVAGLVSSFVLFQHIQVSSAVLCGLLCLHTQ